MSKLIDSKRGAGSTLDDGVRNQAEAAMGTSFDGVRVHRDSDADMINRNITAKAFTTGNDIFLRGDQNPGDASLMTHELTHVIQQRSMGRCHGAQGEDRRRRRRPYEREADQLPRPSPPGKRSARWRTAPTSAVHAFRLRYAAVAGDEARCSATLMRPFDHT